MDNSVSFIEKTLELIISRFNKYNVNYYVVGAIGAYIDAGIPFQRVHDDIDLMIEEKI